MPDALDRVLELVAEGRLSPDEAAPIIDALMASMAPDRGGPAPDEPRAAGPDERRARFARIEVRKEGKRVVDLRVPFSLGKLAVGRIPGLAANYADRLQEAFEAGLRGPIVDLDDDGDGVRIVLE